MFPPEKKANEKKGLKREIDEKVEKKLFISPVFTQFPRKQQAFNIGKTVIGCHPHFRLSLVVTLVRAVRTFFTNIAKFVTKQQSFNDSTHTILLKHNFFKNVFN